MDGQKGLEFAIHADAAWGGYFRTMMISNEQSNPTGFTLIDEDSMASLPMSDFVATQNQALPQVDSITIDPHKSGYVPYPAGGLCYRNSAMRNHVSFTAPVVYHGGRSYSRIFWSRRFKTWRCCSLGSLLQP